MPIAAQVADVEDVLDRSLADDTARIERLITRAEGIVAGDMPGLTFGAASGTAELYGDGDEYLVLPFYPVTSVTSVTVDGVELAAGDYKVDTLGRLRRYYSSAADQLGVEGSRGRWPDDGIVIVVSYAYGFASADVPAGITAVVVELVSARVTNPEQVAQESTGDRSRSYGSATGVGDDLSAGQRRRLRHWRRNRVASARLRV